jgi:hypothetical protein
MHREILPYCLNKRRKRPDGGAGIYACGKLLLNIGFSR